MNIKPWLVFGLFFLCFSSFGASVTGKLSGDKLRWVNGHRNSSGEFLVSNSFDNPSGLPETSNWFPGTFAASANELILLSESGDEVSVPALLVGATYQLTRGYSAGGRPAIGTPCTIQSLSGQAMVADSSGAFCVASNSALYESATIPFSQYQPILKLNNSDLIKAFENKPTGTYSGTMTGTLRYGFYVNATGHALSYRNVPVTFSVQIRNIGSQLSKVIVLGNGHIQPTYNTYRHTASGKTAYRINAFGDFDTGVQFRFVGKDNDDYKLKSTDHPLAKKIPYTILCTDCQPDSLLVEDGVLRNPESWNRIEQSGSFISFNLDISYDNVNVKDVVDGHYQDTFTLMLEAIL